MSNLEVLKLIDQVSDQYEGELRAGRAVEIEDYLRDCDESVREHILHELISIREQYQKTEHDTLPTVLQVGSTAEPVPLPSVPHAIPEQLGDYRLLRVIGRGGMGIARPKKIVPLGLTLFSFATIPLGYE